MTEYKYKFAREPDAPPQPTKERACNMCGKKVPMTRFQRFCGSSCRDRANEIYRTDSEFVPRYNLGNK